MCKVPLLAAFQVVLSNGSSCGVGWFWLLKPMCALDCVIQLLRRSEGICTSSRTSGWQRQALPWAGWPLVLLSFCGKWNDLWLVGGGWTDELTALGPHTDHTCHLLTFLLPLPSPTYSGSTLLRLDLRMSAQKCSKVSSLGFCWDLTSKTPRQGGRDTFPGCPSAKWLG